MSKVKPLTLPYINSLGQDIRCTDFRLAKIAAKEKQISRQVDANLELKNWKTNAERF